MSVVPLQHEAVLRVGAVSEVSGRTIYVTVDKDKNLSNLFLDGDVLKNISVNSFLEIRKGFLSIIGRVEGERIKEEAPAEGTHPGRAGSKRILTVSLSGYVDETGQFTGGTKELPLIGNEAYIITREKLHVIHSLLDDEDEFPLSISIAVATADDVDVSFPVDGLFNSHIAIFGNTGSGKSNTLAYLYQELVRVLLDRNPTSFWANTKFLLFDFNGEYSKPECISRNKAVYSLSTLADDGDRIPLPEKHLLEIEVLSILADATEKTQKPFLNRARGLFQRVLESDDALGYMRNILRKQVTAALELPDRVRAFQLLDYLEQVLPAPSDAHGNPMEMREDLEWHAQSSGFKRRPSGLYFNAAPQEIKNTIVYKQVEEFQFSDDLLQNFILFLYVQLTYDVLSNRAQNEHIAPVIGRLTNKRKDIDKIFDTQTDDDFWASNFVVINMHNVNIDMKKTLPLLVAKKLYDDHKQNAAPNETLSILIDEAHNILSAGSFREADTWRDYRLETFEEIVKEGRKFGVFVTIASQRPNDISPTITSQAHNYFIHRLINEKDLNTIASAVSYIDRVTRESIPTLPTGTCIFSGVAGKMPLKVSIKPLSEDEKPQSGTRKFKHAVPHWLA